MKLNLIRRVLLFYYDGFRNMRLGKTLWLIILIKLFIIFIVLKLFFFPNYIRENSREGCEADFVSTQLEERMASAAD